MVAVAAISFTSCSNNFTEEIVTGEKIQFNVSAVNEEVTRSAFGVPSDKKYPTLWSGEEGFALNINGYDGKTTKEVEATFSGDKRAVNLSTNIVFDAAPETYTLYAIAPATAYVSVQPSGWQVTIPTSQTTGTLSCDPAAQILVGASETKASASETFDMTFKHAVAYGKMTLKNLALDGATISSVAITSTKNIANRFYINQATREYSENSGAKTITVNTTSTENIWFALAPVDVSNTQLKIVVNTDKGTFTKTVTMPANRKFELGKISTFNVDMNGIELAGPDEPEGETIEFVFADEGLSNGKAYTTFTKDGINVIFGAGTNTNNVPMYYTGGEAMRMYKQNTLTISGATITNISMTLSQDYDNLGLVEGQSGSLAYNSKVYTWSGNDTSVEFHNKSTAASNNQVRIQKIAITYIPDPTAQSMSVNKTSVDVTAEATTEHVNVSLKNLEYSDVTVTSSESWVVADHAEGDLTLNILENESTDARTATVTISVGEFSETITINQEGKPTLETVTIAQFLEKSTSTTAWYQLTGTISDITSTVFGNFDITDETGNVEVYGLTATKVTSNDQSFASIGLKEGDVVTLIGTRDEYYSSAQVGGPAYYVSHVAACAAPEITCADNLVTITAEDGATIYYTIDGTEPSISSPAYSAPFEITKDCVVKAFAIADGKAKSVISEKTCVYADPNAGTSKKSYTFTITTSDFNSTSYAANNNEKTSTATAGDGSTLEVKWTSNQVMYQNRAIQWQKSKGYIYNSTDLGTITNIDIDSTGGSFTTYTNSTVQPTSNGVGGYFKISVGGATGYVKSITITFEK